MHISKELVILNIYEISKNYGIIMFSSGQIFNVCQLICYVLFQNAKEAKRFKFEAGHHVVYYQIV